MDLELLQYGFGIIAWIWNYCSMDLELLQYGFRGRKEFALLTPLSGRRPLHRLETVQRPNR